MGGPWVNSEFNDSHAVITIRCVSENEAWRLHVALRRLAEAASRCDSLAAPFAVLVDPSGDLRVEFNVPYGENLSGRISTRGAVSFDEAIQIFRQVADAVVSCHRETAVHGAIIPHAVYVVQDDQPRARLLAPVEIVEAMIDRAPRSPSDAAALDFPPWEFYSPELVWGSVLDQRADVYGLGVLLHAMITGRPPFEAPPDVADWRAVVWTSEIPALSRRMPALPCGDALDGPIARAVSKDPSRRQASVAEFVGDVLRALGRTARLPAEVRMPSAAPGRGTLADTQISAPQVTALARLRARTLIATNMSAREMFELGVYRGVEADVECRKDRAIVRRWESARYLLDAIERCLLARLDSLSVDQRARLLWKTPTPPVLGRDRRPFGVRRLWTFLRDRRQAPSVSAIAHLLTDETEATAPGLPAEVRGLLGIHRDLGDKLLVCGDLRNIHAHLAEHEVCKLATECQEAGFVRWEVVHRTPRLVLSERTIPWLEEVCRAVLGRTEFRASG